MTGGGVRVGGEGIELPTMQQRRRAPCEGRQELGQVVEVPTADCVSCVCACVRGRPGHGGPRTSGRMACQRQLAAHGQCALAKMTRLRHALGHSQCAHAVASAVLAALQALADVTALPALPHRPLRQCSRTRPPQCHTLTTVGAFCRCSRRCHRSQRAWVGDGRGGAQHGHTGLAVLRQAVTARVGDGGCAAPHRAREEGKVGGGGGGEEGRCVGGGS